MYIHNQNYNGLNCQILFLVVLVAVPIDIISLWPLSVILTHLTCLTYELGLQYELYRKCIF